MELEDRVENLEREVKTLKSEIQATLNEIQETLPKKTTRASRWQAKAWVLSLINLLIAVALFANIYLYLPGSDSFGIDPSLFLWLRALWLALALIWLLLQLYPLALLFEEDDNQWKGVMLRNAAAFLHIPASFWVVLTLAVLIVAIINSFIPAAWLVVTLAILVGVVGVALRNVLDFYRTRSHADG